MFNMLSDPYTPLWVPAAVLGLLAASWGIIIWAFVMMTT
jgi:hypothetical protein